MKQLEGLQDIIKENNINIVFFAETHGLIEETSLQREIIERINPKLFLYELLEEEQCISLADYDDILAKDDNERFSYISTYKDIKPTIKLAKEFNLSIIGCDIKDMCRERKMDWKNEILDPNTEDIILSQREEKQNSVIKKYCKSGVVFVSVGAYHLREHSTTLDDLEDYVIIYPVDDERNEFPTEFSSDKTYKYKIVINKGIKMEI
jgi:hypothetical protein